VIDKSPFHQSLLNKPRRLPVVLNSPSVTKIEWDADGVLKVPRRGRRLSDSLVFLVVTLEAVPRGRRNELWPADFDRLGDISFTRLPAGDPVIIWAFGLPFIPVYGGYYAMVGQDWSRYLWLVKHKAERKLMANTLFTFGQFVAPWTDGFRVSQDALQFDWDDAPAHLRAGWYRAKPPILVEKADDMVLTLHNGSSLLLTPVHNFTGFHPSVGSSKSHTAPCSTGFGRITSEDWQAQLDCPYARSSEVRPDFLSLVHTATLDSWDGSPHTVSPNRLSVTTRSHTKDSASSSSGDKLGHLSGRKSRAEPYPAARRNTKRQRQTASPPAQYNAYDTTGTIRTVVGDCYSSALTVCDRIDRLAVERATIQSTQAAISQLKEDLTTIITRRRTR
jgi:hypothetical protein